MSSPAHAQVDPKARAATPAPVEGRRIALLFHGFSGGGMERSMLRLATALHARGHAVEFVVGWHAGEIADCVPKEMPIHEIRPRRQPRPRKSEPQRRQSMDIPDEIVGLERHVRKITKKLRKKTRRFPRETNKILVNLKCGTLIRARLLRSDPGNWPLCLRGNLVRDFRPLIHLEPLPRLVRYLRRERPDIVLAAEPHYNAMAVLARRLTRVPTRVVLSERNQPSLKEAGAWQSPRLNELLRRAYLAADAVVAVSDGVAEDLAKCAGIPRSSITTIYNPVTGPELAEKARAPLSVPCFAQGAPPVILAAGKLHPQKDYATLVRAFARVRRRRPARLVVLGAIKNSYKSHRQGLIELAGQLGIAEDVEFPGFVENTPTYMARSKVFVLSSAYEGLPAVLIEALACGCPVVSTDCPSGPYEILDGGRYGALVPVGNDAAMATAIEEALDHPPDAEFLMARADSFSVDRAVDAYLKILVD